MESIKNKIKENLENKIYLSEEGINKTIFDIKEKLAN
jgi:predicted sulfurtransferase